MSPRALITGITGQDGSYLAEYLLDLGYEVHGLVRRVAFEDRKNRLHRIEHLADRLILHAGSVDSPSGLVHVFGSHAFDECYHLAAQSFVAESFRDGFTTMNVNIAGMHHVLTSLLDLQPRCKLYVAGTSEMFGKADAAPQNEESRFHPRSAYGISKAAGFYLAQNYRDTHGMFCCNGILYNHESPRRGYEYVTRKITSSAARIHLGMEKALSLGNLDARRDWGHARDYVRAMHLMLQHSQPDDYVIATGETHSVRELCDLAFEELGMDYREYVRTDERFYRPEEPFVLVGDASKAHRVLGWRPRCSFQELVREMVRADLAAITQGRGERS